MTAAQTNLDLYLNASECAEKMGYSRRHFVDRISKKPGFPKKIGRKWYWPDIARFMAEKG